MYLPAQFDEQRVDVMHDLIRAHPLASIVIVTAGRLAANHIPMRIAPAPAPFGTLRGHVARANPLWRDIAAGTDALAIFQGPNRYISPSHYATKRDTAKVVPTWNYAVVHAHGTLRPIDDPTWLRAFLDGLTDEHESKRAAPWKVTDAPEDFVNMQLKAIVGVELTIASLMGKWKVSQNRLPVDRQSTIDGLRNDGDADSGAMADLIERAFKGSRTS
ncbi:MAG: FMN-binding negative transcriptional regulator [Burkholderiales bacterium]